MISFSVSEIQNTEPVIVQFE